MANEHKNQNILKITASEQYRTIEELFERSQPGSVYYTLLILSVFIITPGLLLNNAFITVGGLLVAPLLTPILAIALGFAVGEISAIKGVLLLVLKSVVIVLAGTIVFSLVMGVPENVPIFSNTLRTAILYFIVAASSGVAATFAWARKEIAEILPGIAVAIALLPPLILTGMRLSVLDFEVARFFSFIFLFNLLGILVGSLVVFSLLKFYRTGKQVVKEAKEADHK